MEKSILDIYCHQMSRGPKIRQLSPQETEAYFTDYQEICQAIDEADPSERGKLLKRKKEMVRKITTSCLPYVLRLAQNYARGSDDRDLLLELLGEGNVGLCVAVTKFEWKRGVPFHSYASHWIKANYQNVMRSHYNLVKNSTTPATVYYEAYTEGQRLPDELHESVEDHTKETERLETIDEVQKHICKLPPIQQMVFRLCEGFVTKKGFKFTHVANMFGEGFSSSVGKSNYSKASKEISTALRRSSTNSSESSCDGSALHA